MSMYLSIGLLLLVVLVAGVSGLLVALARRPAPSVSGAATAARQHAGAVAAAAWCVAVLAPVVLVIPGDRLIGSSSSTLTRGVLIGLGPASVGLLYLAVHVVGELTWPRPTGTIRRATLEPRSVRDVAPRWLLRLTWTWTAVLALTLVICGIVATGGRSLSRSWEGGATTASPFPGWFYGIPLLVAATLVVGGAHAVLRLITRRPAVMDAQPSWDLDLRRLSAHRVLRGVQLVLGTTTAGVLLVAASAVSTVSASGDTALSPPSGSPWGVALHGLVVVIGLTTCVATLIPGRPASARVLDSPGPHEPVTTFAAPPGRTPEAGR